jgi:hypothetical protein
MLSRNSIATVIGKGMGPLEAAEALKMLEGTAKLLWKLLFRFVLTVFGLTATTLFQAYLFVRLFPAFT